MNNPLPIISHDDPILATMTLKKTRYYGRRRGNDNWRITRSSCSYYAPYHHPNQIRTAWMGRCVIKLLDHTNWQTCHDCKEHQERSGFQIHIDQPCIIITKLIKRPKNWDWI